MRWVMTKTPLQDKQFPPVEEGTISDQLEVVPPPMNGGDIRVAFLTLIQAINSQDNSIISQVQALITNVYVEIGPGVPQHANTMALRLRVNTRINPLMLFG